MKRQTLHRNMLAATAALFTIAFILPQTSQAQILKIDGTEMNLSASADLSGDWLEAGKVHWNAATKTLTLDNATLVSKAKPNHFVEISEDLTLKLVGSNSIRTDRYAAIAVSLGKTTINGDGTLKTKSTWMDIFFSSGSTLTIDGCEVETTEYIGNNNNPAFNNHLVVKNATLKTTDIARLTTITLAGCHIQSPEGGKIMDCEIYGAMGQIVVDAEGTTNYDNIVIVPDGATGISQPAAPATAAVQEIHSLDGSRQSRMRHGVNIVKMNDGTTRKVICRQ